MGWVRLGHDHLKTYWKASAFFALPKGTGLSPYLIQMARRTHAVRATHLSDTMTVHEDWKYSRKYESVPVPVRRNDPFVLIPS